MVVQSDVRLTVTQTVIPEKTQDVSLQLLLSDNSAYLIFNPHIVSVPEDKRYVALLALAALHGAVQRHTGVSKGKMIQPSVHVVCVAFVALQRRGEER